MRIATNTLSIGVPTLKHTGDVALRVTDLRPVAELKRDAQNTGRMEASAASHTMALDRLPKTPTQKMSAPLHVMREAPSSDSVPWFLAGIAATMPYVPQTFKGVLPQALTVMVAARLAPLVLPTVALATALYPRQLGDASLYVPLDPSGRGPTDGFKPLEDGNPVLAGVPHTQYTRPPTPHTRELPITDTSKPQLHVGGQPVDLAPVPGKVRATPHWTDNLLLASEKISDAASKNDGTHPSDQKESLSFSDVEVSRRVVEIPNYSASLKAADQRLSLKFQTRTHGGGAILIRWPEPGDRHMVVVDLEKTTLLPNREAGEILAHALGYAQGFIPERALHLKVIDTDTKRLASADAALAIARWALAMHGKKTEGGAQLKSNHTGFAVSHDFRTTSYVFERPITTSGHAPDGPGLSEQRVFRNLSGYGVPSNHGDVLPRNVFLAQDLDSVVMQSQAKRPDELIVSYVLTAPAHEGGSPRLQLGISDDVYHHQVAQGRDAYGAGTSIMVYDPRFGSGRGGYRTQFIFDNTSMANATGRHAKTATESAYQEGGLDGAHRWVSVHIPVSVAPFAGLQVMRHPETASTPERYEVKIPDARALEYSKNELPAQAISAYADLASLVIEPMTEPTGTERLAYIQDIKMVENGWPILPTLIGQALEAVQL